MKTLLKKSISLFLTVLMLLSCWVWVAPEKAEAAQITPAEKYSVEIIYSVSDAGNGGNVQCDYVTNNGTGTSSGYTTVINSSNMNNGKDTFTVAGWPKKIKITAKNGGDGSATSKIDISVTEIKINGYTVMKGTFTFKWTQYAWTSGTDNMEFYPSNDAGTAGHGNEGDYGSDIFNWPKPKIVGFVDNTASGDEMKVGLKKIGEDNSTDTTSFNFGTCYDQYGVKWTSSTYTYADGISSSSHIATSSNGEAITEEYVNNIKIDGDGIEVSPNLQVDYPQADGNAEFYFVKTYKSQDLAGTAVESKVSSKITITYPTYTVNFKAGLSNAKITADKEYTKEYSPLGFHSGTITVPSKTEADGYTFYDYWSEPQPTTGDASYNAATADFAQPCSSEDYASYLADGGKEEGKILTDKDGNKWYNAGKKLDPTTAKTIDVSENYANFTENWYGWWLAKDLSIKFYDVDGSFLGEKLVKSGQTQSAITWPTSKYSTYNTGAFTFKVDANIWEATDGTEINKNSYTFTKDLILTPKLTRESYTDKYAVAFKNPNNGNSISVGSQGGNYNYRQEISTEANEALGKVAATPSDVMADLAYSYELLGWSSVVPTTGKNYHVLLEDADFDVNNTSIGINKDWVVRDEATYYAVYRRHVKSYVVNFNYKDATGAEATRQLKVKYGANLVPPTDYVPYTYVTKGFGYTFNKWIYTTDSGDATLDYSATIPFTSENIQIAGAALDDGKDVEPIVINATYGDPVATPYTVTFNYVDDKNEEKATSVEVKNEQFIQQETVDSIVTAEKWDFEDNLYTFANQWEITEGSATVGVGGDVRTVGDKINTADLKNLTPTSNITFKAVYSNPVPFYYVTYIYGTQTFEDRVLQGSNVPEWTYKVTNDNGTPEDTTDDFKEDKIFVPEDYEGDGGTYVFQGWYDEKQADDTFAQTNGNKVTTADKVTKNLTLYAQFKFVPYTYTVKFMNYDGTVQLAAGMYEKGQNIEALITWATKAAQTREADDTYTYLFLGWDKPVSTFCEGYDVTFTAQYKPVYKYYDVKWYNSKLVDGKWVADKSTSEVDGETVETNLLATTHHTFNSKLYTPAVDSLACLETAPAGQNYVFAGWYYNDADGNAVKYERGMLVTAEMEFYATYTLTAKTYTVTTVVKGKETTYAVADGDVAVIPDPQAGYVDETYHDAFDGWYTDENCTTAFEATAAITADVKIYAKFTQSEHDFTNKELKTAPTYYAKGVNVTWCSCDESKTEEVEIPMLTDTVKPTGTIYLGDKSWSSTGDAANATDDEDVSIFVNGDTDIIITSNDTGNVDDLYNPAGLGIGVKYIRAFAFPAKTVLTSTNYGAAQSLAIDVYVDETEALTNNANFAVQLSDFYVADLDGNGEVQYDENDNIKYKPLESGEEYIIYYYVVDKAGNQLNTKVRTAKFLYDTTAPVFTVEGTSNTSVIPTYCGVATVTGIEKDAVLTVNGNVVEVAYEDGATTGTYTIEYAENIDNVIIVATDKAGNTYSKKIKVANHNYVTEEVKSTCTTDGYKKEACTICGDVKTDVEYEMTGHVMGMPQVTPADCLNDGYVLVECDNCDYFEKIFEEDGELLYPALGHDFEANDDGIVYKTVTASTCSTKGKAEAYCRACNGTLEGGYLVIELDLDTENHGDRETVIVEATCTLSGSSIVKCKDCGHKFSETVLPATGHGTIADGTAEWYVTKEATCYQKGEKTLKCLVCSAFIEVDGELVTEEIAATGEHVKTVTNPDTYKTDGEVRYHCATEGCPHKYEPKEYVNTELKSYTVKFYAEDGKTLLAEFTKTEGEYIAKDAVTAPEKANSANGEYKYSFAGWKNGDKTSKLPLEVTKDMVLTATYKATKILYTHQFVIPNGLNEDGTFDNDKAVEFKTLVGAIGDERVPSATPVLAAGDDYTYEFTYWADISGHKVADFTITNEDRTFYAKFDTKSIKYEVIFYSGNDFVWNTVVDSGSKVKYENYVLGADGKPVENENGEYTLINPTKDFDAENHYVFDKWYADPNLETEFDFDNTKITGKTRIYAGYTAVKHNLEKVAVHEANKAATCTDAGAEVYACKDCKYEEVRAIDPLGHLLSDEKTYQDGVPGYACTREGCDYFEPEDIATFTVTFKNGKSTLGEYTVVDGKKLVLPEGTEFKPTKAETAEYKYTFANKWSAGEKEYTLAEILALEITEDYVFEAVYTAAKQVYVVSYLDVDHKAIVTKSIAYGEKLYAYDGAAPTKESDYTNHYEFKGWDKKAGEYTITGDTYVLPVFTAIAHVFSTPGGTPPTCEEAGKKVNICSCGYEQTVVTTEPALGHTDIKADGTKVTHTIVEPTIEKDGSDTYICTRCNQPVVKKLDKLASTTIVITVFDADGNPAANGVATVTLKYKSTGVVYKTTNTNENGQAIFVVPVGHEWIVGITGKTLPDGGYGGEIGKGETSFEAKPGTDTEEDPTDCSCSCHKTTFWGWMFRLFHKLMKLFTGKISCCNDPSDLY